MGKITGFLEFKREEPYHRPVEERVLDWREFEASMPEDKLRTQAARCMDCGVPFCHRGCPLGNLIPDWNDLVYRGRWREAVDALHSTNNFPEITGRICPAPCEAACVLSINDDPVTIKLVEKHIGERAFEEGWVTPVLPQRKTGKRVAVVGSGPAGLACAQQLARVGHSVTVFERDDRVGGLLTYGIPDFKLEKWVVQRRIDQMIAEGVEFRTNCNVGVDIHGRELLRNFDAVCLTIGATRPRDLKLPGRELKGIHFAMEYLVQQNKRNFGDQFSSEEIISAAGKRVVVVGGGDTGSDCVGTANRQGARLIHQFQYLPRPPEKRTADSPWPEWPKILRTSYSHEEGVIRDWNVYTVGFSGENGHVRRLHGVRVKWRFEHGRRIMEEIKGSEFTLECDLVLIAAGFAGPEADTLASQLKLKLDGHGNVIGDESYMTNVPGVFVAGDARRGQSLVVWAIWEGREAARAIDRYLMGETRLPSSPYI